MKLFKNGSLVLVGMSVFALVACNSNTPEKPEEKLIPISQEEAREYLKDANTEEASKMVIMDETFAWQTTVTGKGMTPGEDEGGKYGGVQCLLCYLITNGDFDPYYLKELKDLNGQYLSTFNIGSEIGSDLSFMNQEFFDEMLEWAGCENFSFGLKGDLLYIDFDRTNTTYEISFKQEIVVSKTGFTDHYALMFDNTNLEITMEDESGGFYVKADGTLTGQLIHTTQLIKIPEQL